MILITGGSSGLGATTAKLLIEKGFEVFTLSRSGPKNGIEGLKCDVAGSVDVQAAHEKIKESGRRISGIVNCSGVAHMSPFVLQDLDSIRKIIEVNLLGTLNVTRVFSPDLIRNGGGRIVNVSSIAVAAAVPGEAAYAGAKAGVEGFSRAVAKELAPLGVRVLCLAPGPIDTPLLRGVPESKTSKLVDLQVVRKKYTPEDFAQAVLSVMNGAFDDFSGQTLRLGGF